MMARSILLEVAQLRDIVDSVALATALKVLGEGDRLFVRVGDVPEPTDLHGRLVAAAVRRHGGLSVPHVEFLGQSEDLPLVDVHCEASKDVQSVADTVIAICQPPGAATGGRGALARALSLRDDGLRARDGVSSDGPLRVVVLLQVQSYWPSLAAVCREFASRPGVTLEVVAIESDHDVRASSTADFVRAQGYSPRDLGWFAWFLSDVAGPVSVVVTADPYDELRSDVASAASIAAAGVRLVYIPYSANAAGGPTMQAMAYDLTAHRFAWRVFVRSEGQRQLFGEHCSVGNSHVRAVGSPRADLLIKNRLRDADLMRVASGRPLVLWNPHFSLGQDGWSTFLWYVERLLDNLARRDDLALVVRPHFRLFRDLRLLGPEGERIVRLVEGAARDAPNIILDDDVDFLATVSAADALISDLSSLVTEFFVTQKPILYLHREDGPGLNEDAGYFWACDVARAWPDVEMFLDVVAGGCDLGHSRRHFARRHFFALDDGDASTRIVDGVLSGLGREASGW